MSRTVDLVLAVSFLIAAPALAFVILWGSGFNYFSRRVSLASAAVLGGCLALGLWLLGRYIAPEGLAAWEYAVAALIGGGGGFVVPFVYGSSARVGCVRALQAGRPLPRGVSEDDVRAFARRRSLL